MNIINVIRPYWYLDMWVFDDPRVGLVAEPFVGGSETLIDYVTAEVPNARKGFVMLFSGISFPGYQFQLKWKRQEASGNVYYSTDFNLEGWLCPALLKYFTEAPKEIYVQVKPILAET